MKLDWLALRFGWRGGWLILLGTMWVIFGIGVLLEPVPARSWVLYEQVPPMGQAFCWWATGGIALFQGFRGRVADDSLGHVALYLMPVVRLLSFAFAWIAYLITAALDRAGVIDSTIGLPNGWYAALIWTLLSLMLAYVAGWPNPTATSIPSPPASVLRED